jgi:hypothetical protein
VGVAVQVLPVIAIRGRRQEKKVIYLLNAMVEGI